MGVLLGGIPVSSNSRVCDYFRCHIRNGSRAVKIQKDSPGQKRTRGGGGTVLLCFVLIRLSIGEEPRGPGTGYIENRPCPCVKCHSGRLKAGVYLWQKMKSKNVPFCLPSWPGRKTSLLHHVTCEEKPAQGLGNMAQSQGAALTPLSLWLFPLEQCLQKRG